MPKSLSCPLVLIVLFKHARAAPRYIYAHSRLSFIIVCVSSDVNAFMTVYHLMQPQLARAETSVRALYTRTGCLQATCCSRSTLLWASTLSAVLRWCGRLIYDQRRVQPIKFLTNYSCINKIKKISHSRYLFSNLCLVLCHSPKKFDDRKLARE